METIVLCLALNIYFEARNQPIEGQVAVAQVVINRVLDDRYPNHSCGVVTQGPTHSKGGLPIRHMCQFSWYCDGQPDVPDDKDAFRWAMHIAGEVASDRLDDPTFGATHYHSTFVTPKWSLVATKTVIIGDHAFYRWEFN